MVNHCRNGAMRFGAVITVNQQITGQPVQLPKNGIQSRLFPHRHRWRLHNIRRRDHIIIILMVSNIDSIAIVFRVGGFAALHFQAKQRGQTAEHMSKRRHVFWVTWAEKAVNRTENTDQNGVNNGNNKTKNI